MVVVGCCSVVGENGHGVPDSAPLHGGNLLLVTCCWSLVAGRWFTLIPVQLLHWSPLTLRSCGENFLFCSVVNTYQVRNAAETFNLCLWFIAFIVLEL